MNPRLTEWLLRRVLRPEAAEAACGDLLEEYRDSARARLWLIGQVVSYYLHGGASRLRNVMLAGLAISTVMGLVLRFTALSGQELGKGFQSWIAIVLILDAYTIMRMTHPISDADESLLRLGTRWGLIQSYALITGIFLWSFGPGDIGGIGVSLMLLCALTPFAAGAHLGIKLNSTFAGWRAGIWMALLSGMLVLFATTVTSTAYLWGVFPLLTGHANAHALFLPRLGVSMWLFYLGCPATGIVGGLIGSFAGIRLARTGGPPNTDEALPQ